MAKANYSKSNWLSGVNVVLIMAYGSLVFVLLFIFVKRQIMRFAMKSRRGPHVPVGHNAPKDLREEIDTRLSKVQDIRFEPRLLAEGDKRLLQLDAPGQGATSAMLGTFAPRGDHYNPPCLCLPGCYNYLYRMKTLDAVKDSDIPFQESGKFPKSSVGKNFQAYLLEMTNASSPLKMVRKSLLDTLTEGYESARYGTGLYGKAEHERFLEALAELAAFVQSREAGSHKHRQSAAKDLTASPEISGSQVTYLPSSQKSKRPKHFLELKSFKDNYNTLESTL